MNVFFCLLFIPILIKNWSSFCLYYTLEERYRCLNANGRSSSAVHVPIRFYTFFDWNKKKNMNFRLCHFTELTSDMAHKNKHRRKVTNRLMFWCERLFQTLLQYIVGVDVDTMLIRWHHRDFNNLVFDAQHSTFDADNRCVRCVVFV